MGSMNFIAGSRSERGHFEKRLVQNVEHTFRKHIENSGPDRDTLLEAGQSSMPHHILKY